MVLMADVNHAAAGNVTQQTNPELLRKFEAERDAAEADLLRAEELRREGEEQIRRGKEKQRKAHEEAVRELCRIGALPASECP